MILKYYKVAKISCFHLQTKSLTVKITTNDMIYFKILPLYIYSFTACGTKLTVM